MNLKYLAWRYFNSQNMTFSLKHIHFTLKIQLILILYVRNSTTQLTLVLTLLRKFFLVLPFKCSFIRLQTCDSKCVLAQSKARCRHKFWVLSILVFKFAAICYMVLICKDQDLKIDCNLTQHYSWNLRGF